MALSRRFIQPALPSITERGTEGLYRWHYLDAMLAVRYEHDVKMCQIHAWLRYQGRQLGNEVQRFEYDVDSVVQVGCLQLVANISVGGYCQALLRYRRP
jgi:hypothetical protein